MYKNGMGRKISAQLPQPSECKGQTRVWHPTQRRFVYLGPWKSAEADIRYRRLAAEYVLNPFASPAQMISIAELGRAYLEHLQRSGASFNVIDECGRAIESLTLMYGSESAGEFGPMQLTTWCHSLTLPCPVHGRRKSLSRRTIARHASSVIRAYRWAVSAELIRTSETRLPDLERTDPLIHCQAAPRPKKRGPIDNEHVDAILCELSPTLRIAVQVQRATGMRSGELLSMRPMDIRNGGRVVLPTGQTIDLDCETEDARKRGEIGADECVWLYVPDSHKTEHHGLFRAVPILPAVQKMICRLLNRPAELPLFSPRESMAWFRAKQRDERKTRVQPTQYDRSKKKPRKGPQDQYRSDEYRKAIGRAVLRVNRRRAAEDLEPIPDWFPHQLRHSASTIVADGEGNLRGSQALLGHASAKTTEGYARISFRGAVSAAARLGGA